MWNNKGILLGAALLLVVSACSSRRAVNTSAGLAKELSKKETTALVESIDNSRITYQTFNTKARTKLNVDNKSFNATLNIRIKNKEVIWISANAFLGIEAARIMITPDRIQIINRLQSTYVDRPFSYVYEFASTELTFEDLENLFVGNTPTFYENPESQYLIAANNYQITGTTPTLGYEIQLNQAFNLLSTLLTESTRGQNLSFLYESYQNIGEISVPGGVTIDLRAPKTKLNATMTYEDISFNQELSFPFQVPERYKKI